MKITTPQGILEGDNIEAIVREYGFDCLCGANLHGANLCDADLRGADLCHADLCDACLHGADLRGADLHGANLCDADLCHADLRDANHVELSIAKTSILPDESDIIGWKKAYVDDTMPPKPVIVKLLIPADAQRSNGTGRKCRASTARVLDLQDKQGNSLPPDTTAYSEYDTDFTYKKAKPCTLKTSTPTGGTNALQASTSSSPASKQSHTKEAPNE